MRLSIFWTELMADKFTLPFKGDKDAKLEQVERLAAEKGFKFVGDTKRGKFSGDTPLGGVSGTYSISKETIEVTITERPGFIPVSLIRGQLAEFLR